MNVVILWTSVSASLRQQKKSQDQKEVRNLVIKQSGFQITGRSNVTNEW